LLRFARNDADGRLNLAWTPSRELLQRLRNPRELLIDPGYVTLQCLDLRPNRWIERADRRAAGGALHQRQLAFLADRREQRQLKTVSATFAAGRNGRPRSPCP